ncbi:MAG: hypothetical protein ACYCXN_09405 [Acidimicrobiales bacterium]
MKNAPATSSASARHEREGTELAMVIVWRSGRWSIEPGRLAVRRAAQRPVSLLEV